MSSSAVRPSCAAARRKIKGIASVVRPVRPSTRRDSMTILPNARGVGRLLMYSIFIASAGGRTLYKEFRYRMPGWSVRPIRHLYPSGHAIVADAELRLRPPGRGEFPLD